MRSIEPGYRSVCRIRPGHASPLSSCSRTTLCWQPLPEQRQGCPGRRWPATPPGRGPVAPESRRQPRRGHSVPQRDTGIDRHRAWVGDGLVLDRVAGDVVRLTRSMHPNSVLGRAAVFALHVPDSSIRHGPTFSARCPWYEAAVSAARSARDLGRGNWERTASTDHTPPHRHCSMPTPTTEQGW